MSKGVLYDIGLHRGESFGKFRETQPGVSIQIEPSHDRQKLGFQRLVAGPLEEPADGAFVDDLVVLIIDGFERLANRETVESLQVLLQLLKSQLKVNLLGKQNRKLSFHQSVHVFIPWRLSRGSLGH